jgi:tRNA G18 (ribose-2'-O)-methylase SpoU
MNKFEDLRNVKDQFKGLPEQEIRDYLNKNKPPAAILMGQLEGDFNFSNVIRSANSFGIADIFYFGKKRFDRRGAVGVHHYVNLTYLTSSEEIQELKNKYQFVGFENNIEDTVLLNKFQWPTNPIICLGEECNGLPDEIMELLDYKVEIPSFGSVRSLNAGTAAGIAMYDYIFKRGAF